LESNVLFHHERKNNNNKSINISLKKRGRGKEGIQSAIKCSDAKA
jgi:hypothetical protein